MRSGLEDVGLYESSGRGTRDPPTQVPTQIVRVQLVRLPQAFVTQFEISLIPQPGGSGTAGYRSLARGNPIIPGPPSERNGSRALRTFGAPVRHCL